MRNIRKKGFVLKIYGMDLVFSVMLTLFFMFLSFIVHTRAEQTANNTCINFYYGFPLEWVKITYKQGFGGYHTYFEILTVGLLLNGVLYFLLSFILVYVVREKKA